MNRPLQRILLSVAALVCLGGAIYGYPRPSPYPIAWELNFEHSAPKRVVVTTRDTGTAQAFWYVTYTVTNLSKDEQKFLPVFELLSDDGKVIRSDADIPEVVLQTIRIREKAPDLRSVTQMAGIIRVGEDQAKEGVAVWREPDPRMGLFTIYVTGLSGEAVILKDDKGNTVEKQTPDGKKQPVVLWKTLQIRYHMVGDEKFPGNDVTELVDEQWIMR
jgi:hypothetical protein